eukprot:scaffold308771_cov14-Tisochrysis_lutea.AAC.1
MAFLRPQRSLCAAERIMLPGQHKRKAPGHACSSECVCILSCRVSANDGLAAFPEAVRQQLRKEPKEKKRSEDCTNQARMHTLRKASVNSKLASGSLR